MKIALAQIDQEWENKEKNKDKCLNFTKQAKDIGADCVLFPEMTLTGFSMDINKIAKNYKEDILWFKNIAQKYNINIGFGIVSVSDNLGENRFIVVNKEGDELVNYSKLHPFSYANENKYYSSGKEIVSFYIKDILITPFICYDLRFPEIFQIASRKSHLITITANWPAKRKEHWITLLKARAIENQCFVAAVNRVGCSNGIYYSGDSMIINPLGKIMEKASEIEKIVIANIEKYYVEDTRENFPLKKDRREKLYSSMY